MTEQGQSPQEKVANLMLTKAIEIVGKEKWKDNKDAKGSLDRATLIVRTIGDLAIGLIDENVVRI